MRIGVVMMVVVMAMTMIVTVVMAVAPRPNTFNMMVMGFLDHADLILKAQDGFAILAI